MGRRSAVRLNPDLPVELERIINALGQRPQSALSARLGYASGFPASETTRAETSQSCEFRHDSGCTGKWISRRSKVASFRSSPEPPASPASNAVKLPKLLRLGTGSLGRSWFASCDRRSCLAAGGTWFLRSGRAQIDSIAVLPFTNGGGDANTDYLSDGITESLIDSLTHVPQLKVKSRNSVFRYKGKDVDVQKVGGDLGVSALVSGRVIPHGDNIEVSAELTDVRDNTEIWGQHYSGKSTDIVSLQQQIAGDIAEKLRSKLSSSEKQQVTKQGTQNPDAYELYLKGRYSWNRQTPSEITAAITYFDQAISKDPGTLWRIRVWRMPIAYGWLCCRFPAKTP